MRMHGVVRLTQRQNFMNDPNGLFVDANGTYHLYYQCTYSYSSL